MGNLLETENIVMRIEKDKGMREDHGRFPR